MPVLTSQAAGRSCSCMVSTPAVLQPCQALVAPAQHQVTGTAHAPWTPAQAACSQCTYTAHSRKL